MADFVTVACVGDVPEGQGRMFRLGDDRVAVFLVDGKYYALDDFCPHMGASLGLSDLRGEMVVCNRHMWAFRLADGTSPDVPTLRAVTFEVRVAGNEIQVRLPSAKGSGLQIGD
jgi:nitrite reductase/ring-hydroxylating ferredoxin subunit